MNCPECGAEMKPLPIGDHTAPKMVCETLMALALERWRAGDPRPATHEDLREGLPNPSDKLKAMEAKKQALAKALSKEMASGWGFVLMMADFHSPEMTWISSIERESAIEMVREVVNKIERRTDVQMRRKVNLFELSCACGRVKVSIDALPENPQAFTAGVAETLAKLQMASCKCTGVRVLP